jgi:hypothetical protein
MFIVSETCVITYVRMFNGKTYLKYTDSLFLLTQVVFWESCEHVIHKLVFILFMIS